MSAPKSVVKIRKGGVEYVSEVDKANYMMFELTRAALRDVGRFLRAQFKVQYYTRVTRVTGEGGKNTKYKVISGKKTTNPRLNVFVVHSKPGERKRPGFYAAFHEIGYKVGAIGNKNKAIPGLAVMKSVAEANLAKIIEIESKYLSALEDDAKALALIESEDDYEDGQD